MKEVFKKFFLPNSSLFRYGFSYCILLSVLPMIIIVLTIFNQGKELIEGLYNYFPKVIIEPFVEYVLSNPSRYNHGLIISLVIECYLASKAIYSFLLMVKDDEHYDGYNFSIRIESLVLFIMIIIMIIIIVMLSSFINGYIVAVSGMLIIFYVFYQSLSFIKRDLSYGIIGSVFSTVGILLVGIFLFYIVDKYTSYSLVYGPLASLATFFISIYIISNIIYFGYCLNWVYSKPIKKIVYKKYRLYTFINNVIRQLFHFR